MAFMCVWGGRGGAFVCVRMSIEHNTGLFWNRVQGFYEILGEGQT